MIDFYTRPENDPNYKQGVLETSSETECLAMQLKTVVTTDNGEVFGADVFGANIESMLFDQDINPVSITNSILSNISNYSALGRKYNISVDVKKLTDPRFSYREIGLIDIKADGRSVFGLMF